MIQQCDEGFESLQLYNATKSLYAFWWGDFCDVYLVCKMFFSSIAFLSRACWMKSEKFWKWLPQFGSSIFSCSWWIVCGNGSGIIYGRNNIIAIKIFPYLLSTLCQCYLIRFVSVSVKNQYQYQLGTVPKILSAPLKGKVSGQRYRKSFLYRWH